MAVGSFAAVTNVGHSAPTLLMVKVAQVVCNIETLATRTGEHGLRDMPQVVV